LTFYVVTARLFYHRMVHVFLENVFKDVAHAQRISRSGNGHCKHKHYGRFALLLVAFASYHAIVFDNTSFVWAEPNR
jgi:hypothetical protein